MSRDVTVDLDVLVTAAQFAAYARVSRHVVAQWIARAKKRGEPITVADLAGPRRAPRYRFGDLVDANTAALINDTGRGRNRAPGTPADRSLAC